jgi:hypothetical protein
MAYNTNRVLEDNIAAIRVALEHVSGDYVNADQTAILNKYAGFGGLKAILFPVTSDEDWARLGATKDDIKLLPSIQALHELLQRHFTEKEYPEVVQSIKNSVLTAFYTPLTANPEHRSNRAGAGDQRAHQRETACQRDGSRWRTSRSRGKRWPSKNGHMHQQGCQ